VNKYIREYIDKVEIQANNAGYQPIADILRFCSGSQGYQHITGTDEPGKVGASGKSCKIGFGKDLSGDHETRSLMK